VFAVANGDEAMKVLERPARHFALVITDVRMPGKTDGAVLAAWIRNERPEIKVMLISAHPLSEVSAHADASMEKPVITSKLIERVKQLLAQ
jgi:CheY-like chemotaxis protein